MSTLSQFKAKYRKQKPPSSSVPKAEIPPVFTTFTHPIPLLLERSKQWHTLLNTVHTFLSHHHTLSVSLHKFHILKPFEESCMESFIINSMDSTPTARQKLGEWILPSSWSVGHRFEFEITPEGAVRKNLESLKRQGEGAVVIEDNRREEVLVSIKKVEKLRENVIEKGVKPLELWMTRLREAEHVKTEAIKKLGDLHIVTKECAFAKNNSTNTKDGKVEYVGNDPLLSWLEYSSLRSRYIDLTNTLKQTCVTLQNDSKLNESTLVDAIQSLLHEYILKTKTYHLNNKNIYTKHTHAHNVPIELLHFLNHNPCIPRPRRRLSPRMLHFTNHNNEHTKPLIQANLYVDSFLSFIYARGTRKPYVLTQSGFLLKVPITPGIDPIPTRGFRVQDSVVLERCERGGIGGFVLKGWNICRPMEDMMDFRMKWRFSGDVKKCKEIVEKMRLFVPTVGYPANWSLLGWV